jgi:hypothetical protein
MKKITRNLPVKKTKYVKVGSINNSTESKINISVGEYSNRLFFESFIIKL